jgi:hypothetical protein
MDAYDRIQSGLPQLEVQGGNAGWLVGDHQLSAFRSCAKALDLDVAIVMRAAQTNRLAALIEARNGSGRGLATRNITRIRNLYRKREIAARQVPPWS